MIAKPMAMPGLPEDTIWVSFKGTAGQSFGALLARGVTLDLEGEGNDYVGKGLSGGRIVVRPPAGFAAIVPEKSIIVGNTVLYGAIAGECLFPRHRRRALCRAQFRRHRRGRRHRAITAANI